MFPRHVSFCTLALALLAGCTSPPVKKDIDGESFKAGQMLQNDANRAANLAMGDNLESLSRLLDKLYKRNPRPTWAVPAASSTKPASCRKRPSPSCRASSTPSPAGSNRTSHVEHRRHRHSPAPSRLTNLSSRSQASAQIALHR